MRLLILLVLLVSFAPADDRTPVVVELFTSEGCSSCPVADEFLAALDEKQPVSGVEIIALEHHVDYWNQLGWADPFSSSALTARQQSYALAFHTSDIYTPQMVVNGRKEFVGSDQRQALLEVQRASSRPRVTVRLRKESGRVLSLRVAGVPRDQADGVYDVLLAITESHLSENVGRGENAGRLLRHSEVVRSLTRVGVIDSRKFESFSQEVRLNLDNSWRRENLRAVLFVQAQHSREIVGAASRNLGQSKMTVLFP